LSDPRHDLCLAASDVYDADLVVGRAGNISLRLPEGRFLITPSGCRLGRLTETDPVVIDDAGRPIDGGVPSTEWRVHLAIYNIRPDVGAIVHTHSTYATVLAFLNRPLLNVNPETAEVVGEVAVVPALPHGTPELADAVAAAIGPRNALFIERHGVVTVGATLDEAVQRALYLEEAAKMAYLIYLSERD
jgi:ribulose-5-phosphate 4-epimerase/fuculose-1-phosphate aldolase